MRVYLIAVVAVVVHAQPAFQNLAPNSDGSVLYFSSPLRMKGTAQYSHSKIFVWEEATGLRLYAQKAAEIPSTSPYWYSTSAHELLFPSISSDGVTVAVTGETRCAYPGNACNRIYDHSQTELHIGGNTPALVDGPVSVSPNGRFLAIGSTIPWPLEPATLAVRDLYTGQEQSYSSQSDPPYRVPRRHGIANDGTVFVRDPPALRSWPSGTLRLLSREPCVPEVMNASATLGFCVASWPLLPPRFDVVAVDLLGNTASQVTIGAYSDAASVKFDISDDGSLIAFTQLGQAWIVRKDGSGLAQVTHTPDAVAEIALSGDGTRLFVVTTSSRIFRVNLRTATVDEVVPQTPYARAGSVGLLRAAPGGIVQLSADRLPAITSVWLMGLKQVLLSHDEVSIVFQIPFDMPEGADWPELDLAQTTDSPFAGALIWNAPVTFRIFDPEWYVNFALHEDFRGPVTIDDPARPGEIVHAYGRGFGPVSPQPDPGQPASGNPLSFVTLPLRCELVRNSQPALPVDLLFAGLAPGYIGLYQLDVRLPAELSPLLACHSAGSQEPAAIGFLPVAH